MRELHSFSDERLAERFIHVLRSRRISAHADEENGSWVIWIENDDDREPSRSLLKEFQEDPDAPVFAEAEKAARQLELEARKAAKARQRLNVDVRDRWRGGWWKCYPATGVMIALSAIVVVVCTNLNEAGNQRGIIPQTCNDETSILRNALFIQAPAGISENGRAFFGEPDLGATLRSGQIWRLVTPIFLHFNALHILFNMMWLRTLGMSIELLRGTRRFVILAALLAVFSNITQLYWSGAGFGGMSGVVFGLIGYIWIKGRTQPQEGLGLPPDQFVWSVLWMLLCIGGAFGPIANAAHVSGFLLGIVIGARQTIRKIIIRGMDNSSGGAPS